MFIIISVVVLETMVLVSSGLEAKFAGLGLGLAFKQDQDLINFSLLCDLSHKAVTIIIIIIIIMKMYIVQKYTEKMKNEK